MIPQPPGNRSSRYISNFDPSKYSKYAEQNFGSFTPYNPPDSSYYRNLGRKKWEQEQLEKEMKKKAKENELYSKYGIEDPGASDDGGAFNVKADNYYGDDEKESDDEKKFSLKNLFDGDVKTTSTKGPSIMNDILTPLEGFGKGVKNIFDGDKSTSFLDAFKETVDQAKSTDRSKITKEVTRGLTRTANTGTLGLLDEAYKGSRGERANQFENDDRSGIGKVADFGYDALGYLMPGTAAYKGVRGAGMGLKSGSQGLTKARQLAQEGAITGLGLGAGEIGIREGLNADDYSAKDNLKHLGLSTAIGGVADPSLFGVSKYLKGVMNKNKPLGLPEPKLELPAPKGLTEQPNTSPINFMESKFQKSGIKPPKSKVDTKGFDPTKLKDLSGFKAATSDVYRNFETVLGKDYNKVGKPILDNLDSAKGEYVDMQRKWVNELDGNIVKKFGIRKGSKESKLVQQFGEKEITLDELKKKAPNKWKDIVKADQWFRKSYDTLIDEVNKSRLKIYPNNPDKIVPKRDDYYRHFREMNGLSGLKNMFDTPSQISPQLAGTSQYTTPKSKFAGFMQKRGNGPFKRDAVGGFLDYIPAASYSTKIDPVIPEFRNLKKSLADQTEDSRNINNFVEYLDDYANDLSGKTNPFDRVPQKYIPGGRKTFAFLNKLNSRVKANVILGNVGSALAQTANIPIGVAYGKQHSVKGAAKALESIVNKKSPMYQSNFLKERYSGDIYRKFDDRWFQQPQKMAEWVLKTADRVGASFIWNTTYEKALKEGIKEPIKFADNQTRKLIAGRGVGEVPLFQKSKTTQLLLPFTLEVGNQWRIMGDMVKNKDIGALMTLFVGNYVLNNAMEDTRGFGVSFDPIEAAKEAATDEELSGVEKAGRVAGEALSNTPAGQYLANMYPEYGFKLPLTDYQMPSRNKLFGDRNPQRFGTGLIAMDGLTDPAYKMLLPFGGNQVKKVLQGREAISDEGVYNDDKTELKYPVEPNNVNQVKSVLFGPSSFSEAREYYDNKNRPLGEKQTEDYEKLQKFGKGQEYYQDMQRERDINTLERKIKEVDEDKDMSEQEKKEKILYYISELQKLQQ
jgi:hypothetical protein